MTYFTNDTISCLPVYNYANHFFVAFYCLFLFFLEKLKQVYNIQNNTLCFHDMKNLSRRLAEYSKTCLKRPLKKRPKMGFSDRFSLNAGQKYCRMLQWENPAILSTFIKLPFVIKICVLSIFEWLLKTGFTVLVNNSSWSVLMIYKICHSGLAEYS